LNRLDAVSKIDILLGFHKVKTEIIQSKITDQKYLR